jgi:hypothetical protein
VPLSIPVGGRMRKRRKRRKRKTKKERRRMSGKLRE